MYMHVYILNQPVPGTCHEIAERTIGFLTIGKLVFHLGDEGRPQRQVAGAKQRNGSISHSGNPTK